MNNHLKKKTVLKLSIAMTAMAMVLTSGMAVSQTKTLYIGMNGGVMEKTWTERIFPEFEKANNVKSLSYPAPPQIFWPKLKPIKINRKCM